MTRSEQSPTVISLTDYAQHRGVSESVVRRAIKRGRLRDSVVRTPKGNKIGDVALADREWDERTDHTTTPPAVLARLGGTSTEASVEEKCWRAKLLQLEYQQKAAGLIEASEIEAAVPAVFARCRERLLRVSATFAQRCPHASPADVAAVDGLIHDALTELVIGVEKEGNSHG